MLRDTITRCVEAGKEPLDEALRCDLAVRIDRLGETDAAWAARMRLLGRAAGIPHEDEDLARTATAAWPILSVKERAACLSNLLTTKVSIPRPLLDTLVVAHLSAQAVCDGTDLAQIAAQAQDPPSADCLGQAVDAWRDGAAVDPCFGRLLVDWCTAVARQPGAPQEGVMELALFLSAEILQHDARPSEPYSGPDALPLLLALEDHWEDQVDLHRAAATLTAQKPQLTRREADRIVEAVRRWPALRSPASLVIRLRGGDGTRHLAALESLWTHMAPTRSRPTTAHLAAAVALVRTAFAAKRDPAIEAMVFPGSLTALADQGLLEPWLGAVAQHLGRTDEKPIFSATDEILPPRPGSPQGVLSVIAAWHSWLGDDALAETAKARLAGLILGRLANPNEKFLETAASSPYLARLCVRTEVLRDGALASLAWLTPAQLEAACGAEGRPDIFVLATAHADRSGSADVTLMSRREDMAWEALRIGRKREAVARWLTRRLTRGTAAAPIPATATAAREVFDVALADGDMRAVVGLARLPGENSAHVDLPMLCRAWRAGERDEALIRRFLELVDTSWQEPFPASEIGLALAAHELSWTSPAVEKRLVRTLWCAAGKRDPAQAQRVADLLRNHAEDSDLLALYLLETYTRPPGEDALFAMRELTQRGRTTLEQDRDLADAMVDGAISPVLDPFLHLVADPSLPATDRLTVVSRAVSVLGPDEVVQSQLAAATLETLGELKHSDPHTYHGALATPELREIVLHAEMRDRAGSLAVVEDLVRADVRWDDQAMAIRWQAFERRKEGFLDSTDPVPTVELLEHLAAEPREAPRALACLGQLAAAGQRIPTIAEYLPRLTRALEAEIEQIPGVDLALLARIQQETRSHPDITRALARRLYKNDDLDETLQQRLVVSLALAQQDLPAEVLRQALLSPLDPGEQKMLLLKLVGPAEDGDEDALAALEEVALHSTVANDALYRRVLATLSATGRLPAQLGLDLCRRSEELGKPLPGGAELLIGLEEALLALDPWDDPLARAVHRHALRHGREALSPSLVKRIVAAGSHLGLDAPQDDPPGTGSRPRSADPLVQLQASLASVDDAPPPREVERACDHLADPGHRWLPHEIGTLVELVRRGALPGSKFPLFVRGLLQTNRMEPLADLESAQLIEIGDAAMIGEVVRKLLSRAAFRHKAVAHLVHTTDVLGIAPFVDVAIEVAEDSRLGDDFRPLLRALVTHVSDGKATIEQTARVAEVVFGLPRGLLGEGAERGLLRRCMAHEHRWRSEESIDFFEHHLDQLGEPASRQDHELTVALRLQLRGSTHDPAAARRNCLDLLRSCVQLGDAEAAVFTNRQLTELLDSAVPAAGDEADALDSAADIAIRRLTRDRKAAWTRDELDLAAAVTRLSRGSWPRLLAASPANVGAVVDHAIDRGRDHAVSTTLVARETSLLADVLQRHPNHPQASHWFNLLVDRLCSAADLSQVAREIGVLLSSNRLTPSQRGILLEQAVRKSWGGLEAGELADAMWQAAVARGALPGTTALKLLEQCLAGNRPVRARQLVALFAKEDAKKLPGVPIPKLRFEGSAGEEASPDLEQVVHTYLGYRPESACVRALLLDIHIGKTRFLDAFRCACDIRRHLDREGSSSELLPRFKQTLARFRKTTGTETMRNSPVPQFRLAFALGVWLDLDLNPPEKPTEEHERDVLAAVDAVEWAEQHDVGEQNLQLLARKYDVADTALRVLSSRLDAAEGTADLRRLTQFAELTARYRSISRAQELLIPRLSQGLQSKDEETFPAVARCARAILMGSLRESNLSSRTAVLKWVSAVCDATHRFYQPRCTAVPVGGKTAYVRLMAWCCWVFAMEYRRDPLEGQQFRVWAKTWAEWLVADPPGTDDCPAPLPPAVSAGLADAAVGGRGAGHIGHKLDDAVGIIRDEGSLEPLWSWLDDSGDRPLDNEPEQVAEILDGRFRLTGVLSDERRGKRAQLCRAVEQNTGRAVVVKRIPRAVLTDEIRRKTVPRMKREAQAIGKLGHPGLVKLVPEGMHLDNEPFYLAMEWIDGKDLYDTCSSGEQLSLWRKCAIYRDILKAVRAIHRARCVHRNLHPKNVMLVANPDGRKSHAVLTDLGSIKPTSSDLEAQTQLVSGVEGFMAPELRDGSPVLQPQTSWDIYSLGSLLAYMFHPERLTDTNPASLDRQLRGLGEIYSRSRCKDPRARFGGERSDDRGIQEMMEAFEAVVDRGIPMHGAARQELDDSDLPGRLNEEYQDIQLLRGGMSARVYRATIKGNGGATVAIKVVDRDTVVGRALFKRRDRIDFFKNELRELPGVTGIPRLPYWDDTRICLFTEYIDPGISLREALEYTNHEGVPIEAGLCLSWLTEALEQLWRCHRRGILHRVIQPSNILLDHDGRVHLSDFSLGFPMVEKRTVTDLIERLEPYGAYADPALGTERKDRQETDLYSLVLSFAVLVTGHHPAQRSVIRRELRDKGRWGKAAKAMGIIHDQLLEPPKSPKLTNAGKLLDALADQASAIPPASPRGIQDLMSQIAAHCGQRRRWAGTGREISRP